MCVDAAVIELLDTLRDGPTKVARASRKPPQCQIYSLKLWNRKTIRLVLKVLAHIPFTLQWLSMIRCPPISGTFFPFILLRKKERKWKIPSKCSIEFCHQLWTHNLWSIRSFQSEKFLLINILFLWITPYTLWLVQTHSVFVEEIVFHSEKWSKDVFG